MQENNWHEDRQRNRVETRKCAKIAHARRFGKLENEHVGHSTDRLAVTRQHFKSTHQDGLAVKFIELHTIQVLDGG